MRLEVFRSNAGTIMYSGIEVAPPSRIDQCCPGIRKVVFFKSAGPSSGTGMQDSRSTEDSDLHRIAGLGRVSHIHGDNGILGGDDLGGKNDPVLSDGPRKQGKRP